MFLFVLIYQPFERRQITFPKQFTTSSNQLINTNGIQFIISRYQLIECTYNNYLPK